MSDEISTKERPRYGHKLYRCTDCGHESLHGTNHYGEIYPRCRECGWKHPLKVGVTHELVGPVPEGGWVPEPWGTVTLGEVATITTGGRK